MRLYVVFDEMLMSAKKFAVIGNPIAHSRSPMIHAQFAKDCGIELTYEPVLAELSGFSACVDDLRSRGFVGANVTVPFKLEAFAYADENERFFEARWSGAVNTLHFKGDVVAGHNTDGFGLVTDIQNNLRCSRTGKRIFIKGKRIAIIGIGGAAQGVLPALLMEKPAHITLINRTLEKAEAFYTKLGELLRADEAFYGGQSTSLNVREWHIPTDDQYPMPQGSGYDLVINATATGLSNDFIPPNRIEFSNDALAYDMMYGKQTAFLDWAKNQGAQTADGWGMLVEQAAKSFEIWHGDDFKPDTRVLIATKGR
jgi:shikimate dehydrogenase